MISVTKTDRCTIKNAKRWKYWASLGQALAYCFFSVLLFISVSTIIQTIPVFTPLGGFFDGAPIIPATDTILSSFYYWMNSPFPPAGRSSWRLSIDRRNFQPGATTSLSYSRGALRCLRGGISTLLPRSVKSLPASLHQTPYLPAGSPIPCRQSQGSTPSRAVGAGYSQHDFNSGIF